VKPSEPQLCLFILSGEHETLPQAELCAALEAEGYAFRIQNRYRRMLLLKVDSEGAKIATQRAGLVNHANVVAFESPTDEETILQFMKKIKFDQWLKPKDSFGVKITRVQRESIPIDVDELQGKLGSQIWYAMNRSVEVDLATPDVLFLGVIAGDRFFFGPHLASRDREGFFERRSPLRPFFVPSAIHPKFARVMVNLSRATTGDRFFDPFCGTGGLLIEAAEIGCFPIGLDIDISILAGCRQNLQQYRINFNGMIADARAPPIRPEKIEAIATDPPYGRSSSTKGSAVTNLIQRSLKAFVEIIETGGYLCLALPLEHFTKEIIPTDSFAIVEMHTMRIHRSLQRHIVVLQKKE
jgi:tRNA (guanine10-N2)-dimethyltransferase